MAKEIKKTPLLLISGVSGAGKTTLAHVAEEKGFYVVKDSDLLDYPIRLNGIFQEQIEDSLESSSSTSPHKITVKSRSLEQPRQYVVRAQYIRPPPVDSTSHMVESFAAESARAHIRHHGTQQRQVARHTGQRAAWQDAENRARTSW